MEVVLRDTHEHAGHKVAEASRLSSSEKSEAGRICYFPLRRGGYQGSGIPGCVVFRDTQGHAENNVAEASRLSSTEKSEAGRICYFPLRRGGYQGSGTPGHP